MTPPLRQSEVAHDEREVAYQRGRVSGIYDEREAAIKAGVFREGRYLTPEMAVAERDEAVELLRKAAHRLVPIPPCQEICDFLDRLGGR